MGPHIIKGQEPFRLLRTSVETRIEGWINQINFELDRPGFIEERRERKDPSSSLRDYEGQGPQRKN